MKKKIKQNFATPYGHLTKKIMTFVYRSSFLVHFTMLAPKYALEQYNKGIHHFCHDVEAFCFLLCAKSFCHGKKVGVLQIKF